MTAVVTWNVQPRAAWRVCLGAGLVIVLLTFMSGQQSIAQPCGGLAKNYAPIIAFELARSEADLQLIFGLPGDCREQVIARMDSINWIDVLVFIPVYGTFLVSFFIGARAWNIALADIGVKLAIAAIASDYLENVCLMLLTPALDASSIWLQLLPWATAAKWLALGSVAAIAGFIFIALRPRKSLLPATLATLAALICWIALLVAIAALWQPQRFGPVLSPAVGASWVVFLIVAFTQVLRKSATPP